MLPKNEELPEKDAAPKAKAPTVDADRIATQSLVDGWLYDNLSNSPLSRNLECWETVLAALPALVTAILKKG